VKWFPESQRATATGLTTMSLLLATPPSSHGGSNSQVPASPSSEQALAAMSRVLDVFAIVVSVAALLFFALVRREPEAPAEEGRMAPDPAVCAGCSRFRISVR